MNDDLAPASPPGLAPRGRRGFWLALLLAAVLLTYVALTLWRRHEVRLDLAAWTRERAIPYVQLVSPHADSQPLTLELPGSIAAYYDASIHAQVAGYVKSWTRDIGARVRKDEILAEVDTPELDERLAQAREELSRARAALALAMTTAERWAALKKSAAVSKQSSDEKDSDARVKQADVGAAAANLDRLKAQKAFARIVAPFDGVVTARNVDIGAYVAPERGGEPLFKVADIHAVRLYVNVPQNVSARIETGMKAVFTTPRWPDRQFVATVATTANAIGARTGSLLVQLEAENGDGALLPGAYADVRFELPVDPSRLRLPASALTVNARGTRVAVVDGDGKVKFKTVTIAEDFGSEIAIAAGLKPDDRVIDNPADTLAEGDQVRIGGGAPDAKP
jgi:RND family efflux transporter MFP subunit